MKHKKLLSVNADAKTIKGYKQGYLTGIMYLAPHKNSGVMNVCPNASLGCIQACLYKAGRGAFNKTQQARINKTILFKKDRTFFMNSLVKDIEALIRKADRDHVEPVIRLNGTSDLPFYNISVVRNGVLFNSIMDAFPNVQFYDYTKNDKSLSSNLPANYHITFSRAEDNERRALKLIKDGYNVSVVFDIKKDENLPQSWKGYKVINGDESDLRFLDEKGTIVGLRAKGNKKDIAEGIKEGFIVQA